MQQKHRRDPDEVIDHVSFGETRLRIKDLVQVRYLKLPIVDDEFRLLGHRSNPRTTSTKDAKVLIFSYSWVTFELFLWAAFRRRSARAGARVWVYKFGRHNVPSFHAR